MTLGRGSLTYRARVLRDRRQRLALNGLVGPAGTPAIDEQASVAQLVEPLICNQEVMGSSPIAGSIDFGCADRSITTEHARDGTGAVLRWARALLESCTGTGTRRRSRGPPDCLHAFERRGLRLGPSPLGEVPERPKGSDCKSDGNAFAGSNPAPPIRSRYIASTEE